MINKDDLRRFVVDGGRVRDVLTELCGVPIEALDAAESGSTRQFPCPKCGGRTRFRVTDVEVGRVFCSHCCQSGDEGSSDFFGAVQWANDCDFKKAVEIVAEKFDFQEVKAPRRKLVDTTEYLYTDDPCEPARWKVVRRDYSDGSKDCRPYRLENGRWVAGLLVDPATRKRIIPIPYKKNLLDAKRVTTVFIVEGEKCGDALNDLFHFANAPQFCATTISGGTGNKDVWETFATFLEKKKVVVLGDDDKPGRNAVDVIVGILRDKGFDVCGRVFDAPKSFKGNGYDVADFIDERKALGKSPNEIVLELFAKIDEEPTDSPDDSEPDGEIVLLKTLDEYEYKEPEWLWPNRFLAGAINLIAGAPGCGKSMFTCYLAAALSTGAPFPDFPDEVREPQCVLFFRGEDDVASVVVRRLEAFGADLTKIGVVEGYGKIDDLREMTLDRFDVVQKAVEALEKKTNCRCATVIVDPIAQFYPDNFDENKQTDVRKFTTPASRWCAETGVALTLVQHVRKSSKEDRASYCDRVMGSRSLGGAARTIWVVKRSKQKKGWTELALAKSNCVDERTATGLRWTLDENRNVCFDPELIGLDADAEEKKPTKPKEPNAANKFVVEFFRERGEEHKDGTLIVPTGTFKESDEPQDDLYGRAANASFLTKSLVDAELKKLGATKMKIGNKWYARIERSRVFDDETTPF